jgi:hypothetical protein
MYATMCSTDAISSQVPVGTDADTASAQSFARLCGGDDDNDAIARLWCFFCGHE